MDELYFKRLEKLKNDLLIRVRKQHGQTVTWNDIIGQGKKGKYSIYNLMSDDEHVLKKIKEANFNGIDVGVEKLKNKIPPSSRLKTKFNEARKRKGRPMSDDVFELYYAYILSFNAKEQTIYKFDGYYWSYIKNAISSVPFKLEITFPILSQSNTRAIVSASLKDFHDRTIPEYYNGYGYFGTEMNNLFIELHSESESRFKDAVYLILSIGGNLEKMKDNLIRGILTGVSASVNSRPILSMEVVLLNSNASKILISKAKTFLHLHKYSLRVRSTRLNDSFPILSGKIDVSEFLRNNSNFIKTYVYYRLSLKNEVICGTLKFALTPNEECQITNYSYDIILNPIVRNCQYKLEYNQGNIDLIIQEYYSERKREIKMEIRLRWNKTRKNDKPMTGVCRIHEANQFFSTPIILYPAYDHVVKRDRMSFSEFLDEIKDEKGNEEYSRLLRNLKEIYSKDILGRLHFE